jgi:hypothetical protein
VTAVPRANRSAPPRRSAGRNAARARFGDSCGPSARPARMPAVPAGAERRRPNRSLELYPT